ncbi:MAG: ABC transporter ATP-binding protein [Hyphomicrobiaceae bacterium]
MSKHHKSSPGDQSRTAVPAQAPRQAPVLVARGIVKELGQGAGKITAVKGVDIDLRPGELTLLMGPSGSGKTTLLSILGCILSPTAGTVAIDGTATAELSPEALATLRRTHIGYIFQSYNLFPTLNALENVRIALDVAGIKGQDAIKRAEQALRDVGLGPKFGSFPANLSGGEKQRVAVARAIASAPSIVLADEPTAALDSENGHGVMKLLADIARTQNRSILVVTHDPRTLGYADRVIKIEDGLIVSEEMTNARAVEGAVGNVIEARIETSQEPATKRRRRNVDERQMKPMQPEDMNELIRKRKSNA